MDHMTKTIELIKYVILGFIQGFTEPIPISSSGHLVIFRKLFNVQIPGLSFEILVNFGSLLAVLLVYRRDLFRLSRHFFLYIYTKDSHTRSDFYFMILLLVATIPTGIIGLLIKDFIADSLDHLIIVGITLLITSMALWLIRNLQGKKDDHDLVLTDALIIGLAQAIALLPGISRSGATIVAAMLLGIRQETALRFSFLLYIPISLGLSILSVNDLITDPDFNLLFIPYTLAFLASILATYFALKWFMGIMARGNLIYFSLYCFIAGVLVIFLSLNVWENGAN